MDKEKLEKIIRFLSETQMLKRIKHEGVKLAGVENPDSVAEHTALAAQIAYVLAKLEGDADALKSAAINLFHDNEEARLGDHNKVSARYLDIEKIEREVEKEHYSNLPKEIGEELFQLQEEKRERNSKEGIIAQDADWLEMAIQAKIYVERGYKGCENWIDNIEKALETESAKEILAEIRKNPDFLNYWWRELKKMTYKKLN